MRDAVGKGKWGKWIWVENIYLKMEYIVAIQNKFPQIRDNVVKVESVVVGGIR